MIPYVDDLRSTVISASARLHGVSDADAERRPRPGKWSAKEIIGHLIDSAANNHARFVRAQLVDNLVFTGYAQAEWVAVQRYQDAEWNDLLLLWRGYNLHLARLMEAIPEAVRLRERRQHNLHELAWQPIAADAPATLDYFMQDYVAHLHHHLRQVSALLGADL